MPPWPAFRVTHCLPQIVGYGRSGVRSPSIARWFVVAILGLLALVAIPSSAPAQLSTKRPVIGVLSPFIDTDSTFLKDLRDGLGERGLHEGRDTAIEHRSAEGRIDQLPALAEELVRLKVDIIVTASAPAIRFVQQATQTIPIIMARVGDAVDQGLVASLANAGGNTTGTSWLAPELSAKRLELMKEALPEIVRVGILREASAGAASVTAVYTAARKLGVVPSVFEVRGPDELPMALSAMADAKVEGVEILEGPMIFNSVHPLVALAEGHRLPTIFPDSSFVEAGGLMSYGPDFPEIYRRTAGIVEKILKGVQPGNIPVEQPTKFEFAVNLKTAKSLGLTIPSAVVLRADVLIE
jgi:putative ABC transport system substrate-binding protein